MLLQMALFHSFCGSVIYNTCIHHIFSIHSSVNGHLGCFHVLAVENSAALNIEVYVSFWIRVFSRYIFWSGIAGSYGRSTLVFFFFLLKDNCFTEFCCFLSNLWISHRYTYIPSLLNLPLISRPIPSLQVDTKPLFESLSHTANSCLLSILHITM